MGRPAANSGESVDSPTGIPLFWVVLTIHLTPDDLGRIRFAAAPAPILESVLMLFELRQPRGAPVAATDWPHRVRAEFPESARPLWHLVPNHKIALYFDVLTPDADEGFHLVRHMSRSVLNADLTRLAAQNIGPIPFWLRQFADGDEQVRRTFDRALRDFHGRFVGPEWSGVTNRFHDDVTQRTSVLREHGVATMLNSLSPDMWLDGLTLLGRYPRDRTVRLEGQGLVLVPSAYWTGYPLITWDPQEHSRYVLIYPARAAETDAQSALDALLGGTRAAVLRALHRPHTTSGLAASLRISIASASKHASTLRHAGLVASSRNGPAIEHRITHLGLSLLQRQ